MLFIRHRICQSGPMLVVCSVILAFGFLLQFYILYTIHQKNLRLVDHNKQMLELYNNMKTLEMIANKTEFTLHKLEEAVAKHKKPQTKLTPKVS